MTRIMDNMEKKYLLENTETLSKMLNLYSPVEKIEGWSVLCDIETDEPIGFIEGGYGFRQIDENEHEWVIWDGDLVLAVVYKT